MDEVLKKRLLGAAVLLTGALLLSLLLPPPGGEPALAPGTQRVVIDLRTPAPAVVTPEPPPAELAPAMPEPVESAPAEGRLAQAEPQAPPPPPEPSPEPAPERTPEPRPERKPQADAKPVASGPALKLDSQLSKPPAPAPVAKTPAQPVAAPWYVQVGSFGDVGNARQLLERLKPAGFAGLISPAETAAGTRYRARLGPFADRAQAESARSKLAGQGISGATLTQE